MKDGNSFIELLRRRDGLKVLWELFSSPALERDYIDWLDYAKVNRN